ncbi:MAG: hypothetical protein P4N60_16775, partial [Verrucomicrobiae bacterium]|nr:hypothetical protein [Verrucomicrobiae bacterium]
MSPDDTALPDRVMDCGGKAAAATPVQVQNIGNTSRGRMKPVGFGMPWKMNEPMDQRIEFAKKALKTDNFRA